MSVYNGGSGRPRVCHANSGPRHVTEELECRLPIDACTKFTREQPSGDHTRDTWVRFRAYVLIRTGLSYTLRAYHCGAKGVPRRSPQLSPSHWKPAGVRGGARLLYSATCGSRSFAILFCLHGGVHRHGSSWSPSSPAHRQVNAALRSSVGDDVAFRPFQNGRAQLLHHI